MLLYISTNVKTYAALSFPPRAATNPGTREARTYT